ncbi:MAG: hypothetical protein ABI551_15305 [Polyangiaceae bacterium]
MSDETRIDAKNVAVVRLGHGGNCSSIGAVVDTLFVGAVLGSAIFAAVAAALAREPIEIVGENKLEARPHEDAQTTTATDATAARDDEGNESDEGRDA